MGKHRVKKVTKKAIDFKIAKFIISPNDVDRLNSFGVYQMVHIKEPTKIYIGSTAFKNKEIFRRGFYTRWNMHINQLRAGNHPIKELQKFVLKNGIDGIRFSIIEICADKNTSLKMEKYYIDLLQPSYNEIPSTVYQFTIEGELIKKYRTGTEAAKETGIDRASINNTALGNRHSAGGFIWSFKDQIEIKNKRMVQQLSMNNCMVKEYRTLGEAAKAMNTSSSTAIRNAIKGVQHQAYGYKWAFRWTERRNKKLML